MNKFVSTALGLAAVGSVGYADPGDSDWLGLDSEINSLASSLEPAQGGGSGWSALLRTTYSHSSDDIATGPSPADDVSGFELLDIDMAFWGASGDFRYRFSFDMDSGSNLEVEDAYAEWACGTYATAKVGHFKPRVLHSGSIDPEDTLFIDRTALGSVFDFWDAGASAYGENNGIYWAFALMNGSTGRDADHFYSLRLSYDLGAGAGRYEGARGGNDDLNATFGASATSHSGSVSGPSDNQSFFFDFNGNYGQFGFGAEVGVVDDDDSASLASDFGVIGATPIFVEGDSSPYSVTGSYLINPDVEVGLRYEDLDDTDDTTLLTVGASYYRNGNNAKWQFQYTDVDRDTLEDGSYMQVGLVVGASR